MSPSPERFWEASGLVGQSELGSDDDVAFLRALRIALDAELPVDGLMQLVRVYADAMARVAEAEATVFHFQMHDRLRAEGLSGGRWLISPLPVSIDSSR